MDIFSQLAERIIGQQQTIIGPMALELAKRVEGLKIDDAKHIVVIEGHETEAVERLIEQYQHLFGQASVEVCKEAVRGIIVQVPQDKIPTLLR